MKTDFYTKTDLANPGKGRAFIYVLTNPSVPGFVKIGRTTRLPGRVAAQFSDEMGIAQPFVVDYCTLADDAREVVSAVHEKLVKLRIHQGLNLFRASQSQAVDVIEEVILSREMLEIDGKCFRKKQDARWARFFDLLSVPYEYLSTPILIGTQMPFQADFWLPEHGCHLIISSDFMSTPAGKMMALAFSKTTGKPVIQMWECKPGIVSKDNNDLVFNTGYYITPDGEFDGCIEWGVCQACGSVHLGHLGSPVISDAFNSSPKKCRCFSQEPLNPPLESAYETANSEI